MKVTHTVLGVDPGGTTGIALACVNEHTKEAIYTSASCTTKEEAWAFVNNALTAVVIEQFDANLISKYGLHTVEIVGGFEALCFANGVPIMRDTPQQRRPYLEIARTIIINGTYYRNRHEVDAMSHVLHWLYHNVPGVVRLLP